METVKVCCVDPRFGLNIQECGGQWCCEPGGFVTIPLSVYEDMKRRGALGGMKVVGEVPAEKPAPKDVPKKALTKAEKALLAPFAEDTDPANAPEPEKPAETEPAAVPAEEQ